MAKTIHEPKKRRSFAIHEPKEKRTVWTDKDVAEFFGIPRASLQARCRKPVAGELNPNDAEPKVISGRRFWIRDKVMRLAGVAVK